MTGDPINLADWKAKFAVSDAGIRALIDKELSRKTRLMIEWRTAEKACLVTVSIGMLALVVLSLRNF